MTKLFIVKANVGMGIDNEISFNIHAENETTAIETTNNIMKANYGHTNYLYKLEEVDSSIQKMRDFGFPEEMITFEPVTTENLKDRMNADLSKGLVDTDEEEVTMGELEQEIRTKIVMLCEDIREYDGDLDSFETFKQLTKVKISTLYDVIDAMKTGEFK